MASGKKSCELEVQFINSDSNSSLSSSPDPEIEQEELISPAGSDEVLYSMVRPPSRWSLLELTDGNRTEVQPILPGENAIGMGSMNNGLTSTKGHVASEGGFGCRANLPLTAAAGSSGSGQRNENPSQKFRCSSCQKLSLTCEKDSPASQSRGTKDANGAAASYDVELLKKYLITKSKSACSPEFHRANNDPQMPSTSVEDPESYGWHQFVDEGGVGYVKEFKGTVVAIWAKDLKNQAVWPSSQEEEFNPLQNTTSISEEWLAGRSIVAESLQTDPKDNGLLSAKMIIQSNLDFNRRLWHELKYGTSARISNTKVRKTPDSGMSANQAKTKGRFIFPSSRKSKATRNASPAPKIEGQRPNSNPPGDKNPSRPRLSDLIKEEEMLVALQEQAKVKETAEVVPMPSTSAEAKSAPKVATSDAATTHTPAQ